MLPEGGGAREGRGLCLARAAPVEPHPESASVEELALGRWRQVEFPEQDAEERGGHGEHPGSLQSALKSPA